MAAPVITSWGPTTVTEDPDVTVFFKCTDDVQVIQNTLDLELLAPGSVIWTVALNSGVWQGAYNGTITANGGNGFDVDLTTHPLFTVGQWFGYCRCEDGGALPAAQGWTWTVVADDPVADPVEPTGTVTSLSRIAARITDDWALDVSTLSLTLTPPVGVALTAISGGAVQTGWTGSIVQLDDIGNGPREVLVNITGWPDLESGQLWTFTLSCDTEVGTSL
jgi:hypothetical protein